MAIPIGPEGTQDSGTYQSSNLVIWQGSDISCIDLCKGDSISDVTAKLAQKLCELLDETDLTSFIIPEGCFSCPSPENFNQLIQAIIDKLCTCCSGNLFPVPVGVLPGSTCPDCLVTVAPCFYTTNQFGDVITQMLLSDYAKAIGAQVCALLNTISVIQTTLNQQQTQINYILTQFGPSIPPIPLPVFASTCLTDQIPIPPSTGILLTSIITAIESAFCSLRAATGMPNAILNAIFKECTGLDTASSLNLPGVNMGSLPGWILQSNYSTLADSINNMWITICDLRAAVTTIMSTCCPSGCASLILNLQTVFVAPSTINFFWTGDTTNFQDCVIAGSLTTITDAYGNTYTVRIPIVPYMNLTYALNLASTPINTSTNLNIHVDACLNNTLANATCERTIDSTIINTTACPALTLSADSGSVIYNFSNTVSGTVTYTVTLRKQSDNTLVDTQSVTLFAAGPVTGTFSNSIFQSTTYLVGVTITIGSTLINTCPSGVVTTASLACNAPTNVVITSPIS